MRREPTYRALLRAVPSRRPAPGALAEAAARLTAAEAAVISGDATKIQTAAAFVAARQDEDREALMPLLIPIARRDACAALTTAVRRTRLTRQRLAVCTAFGGLAIGAFDARLAARMIASRLPMRRSMDGELRFCDSDQMIAVRNQVELHWASSTIDCAARALPAGTVTFPGLRSLVEPLGELWRADQPETLPAGGRAIEPLPRVGAHRSPTKSEVVKAVQLLTPLEVLLLSTYEALDLGLVATVVAAHAAQRDALLPLFDPLARHAVLEALRIAASTVPLTVARARLIFVLEAVVLGLLGADEAAPLVAELLPEHESRSQRTELIFRDDQQAVILRGRLGGPLDRDSRVESAELRWGRQRAITYPVPLDLGRALAPLWRSLRNPARKGT